ncbi:MULTISPECIES: hypothetical protein [unclassified Colwellia]|jgi:hypothetical protein|uniref:hypothetical protein n=1 Tax=unclassified Colwellia TaxID=196834 RepID=UPI0015F35F25|nr:MULTISPECIES: hypothetical protein [unclassified Colwellia]MBA6231396.1 hypothetical protein [Colwellia sp. MB02u-7]MBA6235659.1 hypothetical protein [Colwellia sp. MB02u-11]MBA6297925.1 hypothetical protein [Colwellia sp. MB3u-22]MBA6309687.1 hypothetical protein [Colwellia sp. MB3u-64]
MISIDLKHVDASSRRFHKTAVLLAEKASNNSSAHTMKFHPIIVNGKSRLTALTSTDRKPDSDFYTPYIVNASLSLEILLKWILYIEKNEWVRGHNLTTLFQQLTPASINLANSKFKELHKATPDYKSVKVKLKKESGITLNWSIASILSKSSLAFEQWRYAFEVKGKSCFLCYGEIYAALLYAKSEIGSS